jgi:hypothetical protein
MVMEGREMKSLAANIVFLFVLASAILGQNNLQQVPSLTIVDANGKIVGTVLGFGGDNSGNSPTNLHFNVFALKYGQDLVTLGAYSKGFVGTDDGLFFTSFDCSGPPLVNANGQTDFILPDTALRTFVVNGKVFVSSGSNVQLVTVNSALRGLLQPGNSYCDRSTFVNLEVLPSRVVVDLNRYFTPPLRVVGPTFAVQP